MVIPSRRSVAPVRKLVAAVLGTIAAFVTLFGLGMNSWPIVALGTAMLALAVSLILVNAVRRDGRTWVAGTAHVVHVSEPPAGAAYGRCELQIVVAAPGLPASAVKIRDPRVPVDKWPDAGATLPVLVAVDDMRHVRIQWDDVMTHAEAMTEPLSSEPLRDLPIDDILPEPETPPWVARDQQRSRASSDAEPVTVDLTGHLGGLREGAVAVREQQAGSIVLEGMLVETQARPATPRRPSPRPYARRAEPADTEPADAESPGAASTPSDPTEPPTTEPTDAEPPTTEPTDAEPTDADPARHAGSERPSTPPDDPALDLALDDPTPAPPVPPAETPDNPAMTTGLDRLARATDVEGAPADAAAPTPEDRIHDVHTAYPSARPGPTSAIHGIGITVLVTDLPHAIHFYRDILGFFEIDSGTGSTVLASGDTRLVLRSVQGVSPGTGRQIYLNLEVGDVDAVYRELRGKGVEFVHAPRTVNRGDRLELWAATFLDPDGHNVAITQWRAAG